MNSYTFLVFIVTISATFAYINQRYIKMPFVIGLFFLSTVLSLFILSTKLWSANYFSEVKSIIASVDISKYILEYMLGYMLFAGSMHTEWKDIKKQMKPITIFAVVGVILSTFIVGALFYFTTKLLGLNIGFIYCLLFGALISPTDPIAVLGIMTKANVPKKIEATIVGESLFNDGIGVVVFIAILEMLNSGNNSFDITNFGLLFLKESIGGLAFGLIAGYLLHKLLSSIDHYETETLLTLAFVMTGYAICFKLHISGPLAMVVMGLFVGNYHQNKILSDITIDYIDKFWELVDIILNAILFVIISFVLVVLDFKSTYFFLGIFSIFIVLLSRAIIVFIPKLILPKIINFTKKETGLIIWGGLRGGLSLALVLSLPNGDAKNILLIATHACVVFSIIVQGLTMEKFARQ